MIILNNKSSHSHSIVKPFYSMSSGFFAQRQPVVKKAVAVADSDHVVPWVEKYRPKRVDDLVFQTEVVAVLKKVLDGADLPNVLFYGPPGTGKTSAAVALCRQLFKTPENYKDRVLEMNASDERGIAIVRNRMKEFAHRAVAPSSLCGKCAALKVIILDEADAMTSAAQTALRRTMEAYSKTTRFFMICNYISRIIDPLTSRCAKFRFKPLPVESQIERMKYICAEEKVQLDDTALETLIALCEGDLRKSITTLQSLASSRRHMDGKLVEQMSGRIPDEEVDAILAACQSASGSSAIDSAVDTFRRRGHGVGQLITQLTPILIAHSALTDMGKAEVFETMAECEARLIDGADESIQLLHLCTVMQVQFIKSDL